MHTVRRTSRLVRHLAPIILAFAIGCGGAFGKAIKRGDQLAAQGQWDAAAAEYENAVRIKPNDAEAQAKLAHVRRRQAADRVVRGNALLAQGDFAGALRLGVEAKRFDPQNASAQKLFEAAAGRALDRAEQHLAANEDHKALELTTLVLEGAPEDARARTLDDKAREKLATAAYERADALAKKGKKGNALLELSLCQLYRPSFRDAGARMDRLKQELREEVTFYAVVGRFGGDARAGDIARELSPEILAQGIDPNLPLRVVAQAPAKGARGVRIVGKLEGFSLTRSQTPSARQCNYVCGRSTVQNQDHQQSAAAVAELRTSNVQLDREVEAATAEVERHRRELEGVRRDVERASQDAERYRGDLERCQQRAPGDPAACAGETRRLEDAQRRLGGAEQRLTRPQRRFDEASARLADAERRREAARNGLASEEQRLAGTPATTEVETQCTHAYNVVLHAVNAAITVRVSAAALGEAGASLDGAPLAFSSAKQDETFAAQPGRCAEVQNGDPLELPTDRDVKHDLSLQAVGGVRERIVGAFEQHRQRYLGDGRREEAGGVREEAVESYVRFLLASPDAKAEGDKERIRKFLVEARGITPVALRSAL
jgi:tetratricopeptide (TPR) repeat protein